MEKETIANEGVVGTAEEITNVGFRTGYKAVALIGLTVLLGVSAYKYVVKPITLRIIDRKKRQELVSSAAEISLCEGSEIESVAS